MTIWKSALLAGAMVFAPLHGAAAQEAPEAEILAPDAEDDSGAGLAAAKEQMQREMEKAVALVEKLFDTRSLPPVEPARLTLAESATAALVPPGSLEKMIDTLYGKMFTALLKEMDGASDLMITLKTGVEGERVAALDAKSKEAVADMFDPQRKQREEQIMKIVRPLLSEALADIEAPMRGGMARAYARKLDAEQLTALNSFFATPAGQAYANESLALQADPEIMLAVVRAMPPMVGKFMDRAPELEGQFKDLPQPRGLSDLSEAELRQLAKLMKVDVKALKEHRDSWNADDEADEAVEAAEEAHDWAAHDRDNWSDEDRARVEAAEEAVAEAERRAVENARAKMPST